MTTTTKFNKQEVREGHKQIVEYLKSDLYVRVPGADGDKTFGRLTKVSDDVLPGDHGYRYEHFYETSTPPHDDKEPRAVSFDAGDVAFWVGPLGWRVLIRYVDYDRGAESGLEVEIYDGWGWVYGKIRGKSGSEALLFIEEVLP